MSTEQTWFRGLEGAFENARNWLERPGTEAPRVPEPTGSRPEAGDGRLREAVRTADSAPEDIPAFISFIETMCGGDRICLKRLLETLERLIIIRELNRCRGNQRTAAVHLGLKYTTLNEKVKKHGLRVSKHVQLVNTWTEP
jgi:transcriptional regulator with AAA-type ATPase domain